MHRAFTVSLKFLKMKPVDKVEFGLYVGQKLADHITDYPDLPYAPAAVTQKSYDLTNAISEALGGGKYTKVARRQMELEWNNMLRATAMRVAAIAGDDSLLIVSAGFSRTKVEAEPAKPPGMPILKTVRTDVRRGEVEVRCSTVPEARNYVFVAATAGCMVRLQADTLEVSGGGLAGITLSTRRTQLLGYYAAGTQLSIYAYTTNAAGASALAGPVVVYVQ